MADARVVRVFISSPEDVRPERGIAARVIQRLGREFSYHFKVEAVLWEREPLLASHHFQDRIVPPRETDIVVVLLWSKLGLPLPRDKYVGPLSGRQVTGTEWEFEDALASYRERQLPDLLLYRKRADVTVKLGDRAALEEQQRQAELVEDFMRRWFSSADGKSATAASWNFTDGAAFEGMLEDHLRALLRQRLGGAVAGEAPATMRWHQGSPYRGLEAFGPEHEPIFFGRTRARNEVRELLARQVARGSAFVLVMGASGSGKSSLVKAGVLPELREAGMVGRAALVRHAITRPGAVASTGDVLSGLAAALFAETALPELAAAPLEYTPESLSDLLRKTPEDAARPIRQGLSAAGRTAGLTDQGEARLLLVVDQLEELFTADGITPDGRTSYVAALEALAASGVVWVIATMRSDFFDRLERLPALARLTGGESRYLLTSPDAAGIGQIIRQPAREAGLTFEVDEKTSRSLDETVREAAAGDAASLPLLEYLLDQLWHRRSEGGVLTYAAYHELGGLEGAIGRRAEDVLASLAPDVRAALPRLLRALVTVRPGARTAATARYGRIEQFDEGSAERQLIEALLAPDARLLVADAGTLRVAHEALLTHWPRALEQIAEDRSDLQLRARLEEMATRWQAATGKDRDSLLLRTGLPLSEAEDLLRRRRAEIDPDLASYVEQSGTAARRRQRRATVRLRAIATVLTLLAVGAGIGAWQAIESRRIAERALNRAQANLEQALALVDTIMTGTVGQFQDLGMPKDRAKALLDQLEPVLARLEREQSGDALAQRRWELLSRLSDMYLRLGDTDAAAKHCRAALELVTGVAERNSADVNWQRRLAMNQSQTGTVRSTQGDLAAALKSFRTSLETRRRIEANDPANVRLKRDLAVVYREIGGVVKAQGDLGGALKYYRDAFDIDKGLATREPDNVEWQYALALDHDSIGDIQRAQGDLTGAGTTYRESLEIARRLAAREHANAAYQHQLAVSLEKVGHLLKTQGDLPGALKVYREGFEIRQRMVALDRANTMWRHDLGVSHTNIADVLEAQGDLAGALKDHRASLEGVRQLAEQDPTNTIWQRGLSISHVSVGNVLQEQGDLAGALTAYRESLKIAERLAARDPVNAEWQHGLAVAHNRVGDVLMAQGEKSEALKAFRESLEIIRRLAARDRDNPTSQRDLAVSHDRVTRALVKLDSLAEALTASRESVESWRSFVARNRTDTAGQRGLAVAYGALAVVADLTGDRGGAVEAARAGDAIIRDLLAQQPDHRQWQEDAAWFAMALRKLGAQ